MNYNRLVKLASQFDKAEAGCSLIDLWEGNVEAIAKHHPADDGREYDASSADFALARRLAFWTGGDREYILILMKKSNLARKKWETRPEYLEMIVDRAINPNPPRKPNENS